MWRMTTSGMRHSRPKAAAHGGLRPAAEPGGGTWASRPTLYRQIVVNGVAATGARFVNLSRFDPATGVVSGVVWAASPPQLAERALAMMRRLVPGFEIEHVSFPASANSHVAAVHFDGMRVLARFDEIVRGTRGP
jgi:hypothetical protein